MANSSYSRGRGEAMRRLVRISVSISTLAVAAAIVMLVASIHSWNSLTAETLIAEISFDPAGEQQYLARLRTGDFCSDEIYAVFGDQWRIDAQFLKWHYWASLFGLESQYRLERLEGRYQDADQQNVRPTLAHALAEPSAIDIGGLSGRLGGFNFLADASYGSSTYHDIDTSLTYLVYKSPTGIFTRTRAASSGDRRDGALTVEVRRGCGEPPGTVERMSSWINQKIGSTPEL